MAKSSWTVCSSAPSWPHTQTLCTLTFAKSLSFNLQGEGSKFEKEMAERGHASRNGGENAADAGDGNEPNAEEAALLAAEAAASDGRPLRFCARGSCWVDCATGAARGFFGADAGAFGLRLRFRCGIGRGRVGPVFARSSVARAGRVL